MSQKHSPRFADVPDRVRRVYEQTGTVYTDRGTMQIYSFEMTETIPSDVLEETFNIISLNYRGPVSRINLEWWEYDGCYAITLNNGIDEFVEPNVDGTDVPTSEETYAKWKEMLGAIMDGTV